MNKIKEIITKQFEKHRILFWYDAEQEFREDYWSLELADVCEKIEVVHDEFGVKHRILILEPEKNFLLYFAYEEPRHQENWLLDLQLSEGMLHIDQGSLWLQELALDRNRFLEITRDHKHFFKSAKRLESLLKLVDEKQETLSTLRLKMLAVCADCDARWEKLLLELLVEYANEKDEKLKLISKCGLDGFFWEQLEIYFGYKSQEPKFKSLVIELFESAVQIKEHKISRDGIHVLHLMKDMSQHREAFEKLSNKCSEWTDAPAWLERQSLETLIEINQFEYAERLIIKSLVEELKNKRMKDKTLQQTIQKRSNSFWYSSYETEYQCLSHASSYFDIAAFAILELDGLESGFQRYHESLYLLDLHYRKFCLHYSRLEDGSVFENLSRKIEDHYTNGFLFRLSASWSDLMQQQKQWPGKIYSTQLNFWQNHVQPYIDQNKKIFVIISDGLRYEVASELMSLIRKEDRFEAELSAMAGTLPSITSIGMAALLPHESISFDAKH